MECARFVREEEEGMTGKRLRTAGETKTQTQQEGERERDVDREIEIEGNLTADSRG